MVAHTEWYGAAVFHENAIVKYVSVERPGFASACSVSCLSFALLTNFFFFFFFGYMGHIWREDDCKETVIPKRAGLRCF